MFIKLYNDLNPNLGCKISKKQKQKQGYIDKVCIYAEAKQMKNKVIPTKSLYFSQEFIANSKILDHGYAPLENDE